MGRESAPLNKMRKNKSGLSDERLKARPTGTGGRAEGPVIISHGWHFPLVGEKIKLFKAPVL